MIIKPHRGEMLVAPTFRSGNKWNRKNSFGGILEAIPIAIGKNRDKTELLKYSY